MKSLNSFLNPKRKKEIRFKLPAFEDEFVMRPLTLKEDLKLAEEYGDKSNTEMMIVYARNASNSILRSILLMRTTESEI